MTEKNRPVGARTQWDTLPKNPVSPTRETVSSDQNPTPTPTGKGGIEHLSPAVRPRVTVVSTVYYQAPAAQKHPDSYSGRFWRELVSDEQPYNRRVGINELWNDLDTSWVKEPGCIIIHNPAPVFQRQPGEEEFARAMSMIVDVGLVVRGEFFEFHTIRPNETWHLFPTPGAKFALRCLRGETKVIITAIPR